MIAPPPPQTLKITRGQDLALRFTLDADSLARAGGTIAGWAVTFQIKDKLGGTSKVSKTVGSGVVLTTPTSGVVTVTLARADLLTATVTDSLADGYGYVWDLKRTDAGSAVVLAHGTLTLEGGVTE